MSIISTIDSGARSLLRRLLQLDAPVPQRTEEETAALVERNYRWNFTVNLVDGSSFWLAMSFVGTTTIVPLFISKLTPSMVPIAYVAILAQAGWFLPQVFTANWVERLPRRKPVVVNMGMLLERLPVALFAVAALMAGRWAGLALAFFLFVYTWNRLGGGVVATAWQDLIARVFPMERRGRFWGLTSAIGAGLGFAGSALSAWLLTAYAFPKSFVVLFSLAAAILLFGWIFSTRIREPALPIDGSPQGHRDFLARLPRLLKEDAPFRRFLGARLLLSLGGMGLGFVTVAAVRRWAVADGTVGLYTGMLLLGQTVGNLFFGLLADRRGNKFALEWAALAYAAAFALAWLAPGAAWYYAVFFLIGVSQGILVVSGILVLFEFSEPKRRPTYIGLANTSLGVVNVLGPMTAAWLAGLDFGVLFAACAGISFVSWVSMRWWVQEPRWAAKT
jgi:MFS family permease